MPDARFHGPPLPTAAYIHVPFCRHRCGYCNFTVLAGRDDLTLAYLDALEKELSWLGQPRPVETLFIGGGTPTHLSIAELRRLLEIVANHHPLQTGGEFSVEANPADISAEKIGLLAEHGVNRLSLGAQSFDEAKLRLLERDHDAAIIRRAVELARPAIESVSLDLIFGCPGETPSSWKRDLAKSLELAPQHVSTYGLTFERGTSFFSRRARGDLREVDDEPWRAMYAEAIDSLTAAGFEHYEVSNFARPGRRCRHNETYWLGGEYFAAGPGAARYVAGRREMNHRSTTNWLHKVLRGESPVAEAEELSPEDRARERLVFGLRRLEGVLLPEFARRTGFDARELAGPAIERFCQQGLLQLDATRLRLTREGLFVSDALWPAFVRV